RRSWLGPFTSVRRWPHWLSCRSADANVARDFGSSGVGAAHQEVLQLALAALSSARELTEETRAKNHPRRRRVLELTLTIPKELDKKDVVAQCHLELAAFTAIIARA